jgi:hypothetical protein
LFSPARGEKRIKKEFNKIPLTLTLSSGVERGEKGLKEFI